MLAMLEEVLYDFGATGQAVDGKEQNL